MRIGTIVKSESHLTYVCQVYGAHDVERAPSPADYAFGRFVRAAVRGTKGRDGHLPARLPEDGQASTLHIVGVIYDTILLNPSSGQHTPRLSNNSQAAIFSPDAVTEQAVLVYVMALGMLERRTAATGGDMLDSATHGAPLVSLELGGVLETMSEGEVRAFHSLCQDGQPDQPASLHMGYLPHILAQRNSLLPLVALRIIEQLECLFPLDLALLSIFKRNFAWRLKVETAG